MSTPAEMTAIEISQPGGPEVLRASRRPVPAPGPGEVLIRVAAAGINAPDVQQRRGRYDPPAGASPLPGLEVSGEIASLGEGAAGHAIGEPVVALCNGGGYAEFVAVPASQVLPLPAGWDFSAGAALPETYFTIQQTLVLRARLEPGMTVLVHGAAGGLGGAAVTISRVYGANPIAVVSSPEKAAYAKSLGAWAVIDRTRENLVERVRALTAGRGADRIIDIVGGDTLAQSLEAAALEAHILVLATLAGPRAELDAGLIVGKRLTLHGSTLRPQPREVKAAIARSLGEKVWPAVSAGTVPAPRLESFPLEDAAAAHAAMEQRGHFGKIVLLTAFGKSLQ
jgi:NADPH2:quinone reductase